MMLSPRYRQMIARCVWLFVAGTALQLIIGRVDASFLSYPWTICVAINYLYILILLYAKSDSVKFVRRLYDRPAYLVSLASMLLLTLLFGLIRQDGSTEGWWGIFGFTRMSSSWIFVLFLLHFTTAIGLKAIDDVHHWKQRKLPVVMMHVSFFVILASAVLGSGEKVRVRVMAHPDHPVSVGITEDRKMMELPFTLTLKEFSLEEYPSGEIKTYLSRVVIDDEDGMRKVDIRVNHPARIGSWRIYQSAYDYAQGKWISILECVKDGWYPMIQLAMWLILAGGVWMMFERNRKKEDKR